MPTQELSDLGKEIQQVAIDRKLFDCTICLMWAVMRHYRGSRYAFPCGKASDKSLLHDVNERNARRNLRRN
jgi:hypothetical protein